MLWGQGPLSRFGDTAANAGTLALLEDVDINIGLKTVCASTAAALFRIALMPIDAFKTSLQVEGKHAVGHLMAKVKANGPKVFYNGSLAASGATFLGHFPWCVTFAGVVCCRVLTDWWCPVSCDGYDCPLRVPDGELPRAVCAFGVYE